MTLVSAHHNSNNYGVRRAKQFRFARDLGRFSSPKYQFQLERGRCSQPMMIKALKPGLDTNSQNILGQCLRREAGVLARLTAQPHRNLVQYYGQGEIFLDGPAENKPVFYLAMEYLPGEDLFDRIVRERKYQLAARLSGPLMSPYDILPVIDGTPKALCHIHEQGWVHADVKPENIMVCPLGGPATKLLDLEHARPSGEFLPGNKTDFGTPEFASARRLSGQAPTAEDDLFALGATLFFALAGYLPLNGRTLVFPLLEQGIAKLPDDSFHRTTAELLRRLTGLGLSKAGQTRFTQAGEAADFIASQLGSFLEYGH